MRYPNLAKIYVDKFKDGTYTRLSQVPKMIRNDVKEILIKENIPFKNNK